MHEIWTLITLLSTSPSSKFSSEYRTKSFPRPKTGNKRKQQSVRPSILSRKRCILGWHNHRRTEVKMVSSIFECSTRLPKMWVSSSVRASAEDSVGRFIRSWLSEPCYIPLSLLKSFTGKRTIYLKNTALLSRTLNLLSSTQERFEPILHKASRIQKIFWVSQEAGQWDRLQSLHHLSKGSFWRMRIPCGCNIRGGFWKRTFSKNFQPNGWFDKRTFFKMER